jgi:hypothetical protein
MVAARTKEANHLKADILSSSARLAEETLGRITLLGLDGLLISFSIQIINFLGRIMNLYGE